MPSPPPNPFNTPTATPTTPYIPGRHPQTTHHQPLSRYAAGALSTQALSNPQASGAMTSNPRSSSSSPRSSHSQDRYNEMYSQQRVQQRQVMEAIDSLRSNIVADSAEARALEELADKNERLKGRLEARERVIGEMYRAVFESGAPEGTLVPLGRIIERCDRELWKRVLGFVGGTLPGRKRADENGEGNGRGSPAGGGGNGRNGGNGNRNVSALLVVKEVDILSRRRGS